MVLARLPSLFRHRDQWSPSSNTSPPATSLSPAMAYSSPAMVSSPIGLKTGFEYGLTSPTFSWGSFFGFNNGNDLKSFNGLTVEDNADSPASSASGSAALMMPFADVAVKLPAWCTEEDTNHSSPEVEEVAPSSALTPSRKLRRTGRLGKTPKAASGPRFEPSSPDLDEGADFSDTRSFFLDPYLHPTPANRPLRQYYSAPELSEHQQQQIMAVASASARTPTPRGLALSSSMDDLLLELGWPSAGQEQRSSPFESVEGSAAAGGNGPRQHQPSSHPQQSSQHPHYRTFQESRPSSSPSAGRTSGVVSEVDVAASQQLPSHSSEAGLGEIDGSLYLRRHRQSRDADMPTPAPINTSTGPRTEYLLQRRSMNAQDARSAPLVAASQQEQQQIDLQQMQLQPSALQIGNADRLTNLLRDYLQESEDPRQGSSMTGLSALDLNLGESFVANQRRTDQPGYGPHYLLYSDPTLQAAPTMGSYQAPYGYTSSYPFSTAPGGLSTPRPRRHTVSRSRKPSTVGKISPQQLGKQELRPTSAGQTLWPAQDAVASSSTLPTANQLTAYTTPRSTQAHVGSEMMMPNVPVFVPAFADPWSASTATPSTSSSGPHPSSFAASNASSGGLIDHYTLHQPMVPSMPHTAPMTSSPKQARKTGSSPNLRLRSDIISAALPGEIIATETLRKIAGTRRVQSSKDLRDKAKRSPDAPLSSLPSQSGGKFSFVNYGIEDAQELCSAVAPSGSYKVPLKGFVGSSGFGEGATASPSSSSHVPSTPPRTSSVLGLGHKAPSVALKNKLRPRVKVDNSRWIQETGEDSEVDSDSEEVDEEAERRGKRRKSEATSPTPVRGRKKIGA